MQSEDEADLWNCLSKSECLEGGEKKQKQFNHFRIELKGMTFPFSTSNSSEISSGDTNSQLS